MSPKAPAENTPEPAPETAATPAAPAAASATPAAEATPAAAPAAAPPAPPAAPAPAAPGSRRRLFLILGIAGGALILVIVAVIVLISLLGAARSAKTAAGEYLDQLVAGRAEQAMLRVDSAADSPLITDAVYSKADNRVTRYEITDSRETGSSAQVTVDITTRSGGWTDVLQLVKVGGEWRIDGRTLPTVQTTWRAPEGFGLAVNGVELDADDIAGQHTFAVLPGTYDITSSVRNDMYEVVAQKLDIPSFVQSGAPEQLDVAVTLTADGEATANRALRNFLDKCARQNTPKPKGHCGFRVNTGGKNYTKNTWTISTRPKADFAAFDGTGWEVITTKTGTIKYKGTNSRYIGKATIKGYEYVGFITFDGTVAYFTSEYEE